MSIEFEVKITRKAIFDFLLYHSYTNVMGMLIVAMGVVNLAFGLHGMANGRQGNTVMYLFFALVFFVGLPIMLWFNAGTQVKSVVLFQKPINYELTDEGVLACQDDKQNVAQWTSLVKVVATKSCIFLYQGKNQAIILPRIDMGEQEIAVIEAISTHVDPSKVKIRR